VKIFKMTVYTKWGAHVQFPVVHLLLAVTLLVGSAFPVRAEAIVNQQFAARRSIGSSYEFPGTSASDRIIIFIVGEFNRSNQTGGSPQVSTVYAFFGLTDPMTFRFRVTAEGFAEFPANSGAQITPSLEMATIKASFSCQESYIRRCRKSYRRKLDPCSDKCDLDRRW